MTLEASLKSVDMPGTESAVFCIAGQSGFRGASHLFHAAARQTFDKPFLGGEERDDEGQNHDG